MRYTLAFLISLNLSLYAEFQVLVPVSYYGWLDQYSMDTRHGFIGNEACVPTSSVNAMTFLQNTSPSIFGTTLTGTTYSDWEETDDAMISIMGTTVANGTYYDQFVWTFNMNIALIEGFPQVQFSGVFPNDIWDAAGGYPRPSYITPGKPTPEFLTQALGAGSAALVSIEYSGGDGHELLVNGLMWDPQTQTGILYFVDPLDPSQNYSGSTVLGPVKQTSGTLHINNSGTLVLTYDQYSGRLPYTGAQNTVSARLIGALSVGGSFYAPYINGSQNAEHIIEGFERIDPTTASLFPILAVLNTTSDLESAFLQFDPSLYNALLFSNEAAVHQVHSVLSTHLLKNPCSKCLPGCRRFFALPFDQHLHQYGIGNASYKNHLDGATFGVDYSFRRNLLAGLALSYAHTQATWKNVSCNGRLNNYGATLFGAWDASNLSLNGYASAFYGCAQGSRGLFIASATPFIAPIHETLHYKNHSNTYAAHLGASCNTRSRLWPFLNLDYTHIRQSSFTEHGGGPLDLNIHGKSSNLIRSEIGLGSSKCFPCNFYAHAMLSFVNETRFCGKSSDAFFADTPSSGFHVYGLFPQNNLICPSLILGRASLSERVKFDVAYRGEFGKHVTANQLSAELKVLF